MRRVILFGALLGLAPAIAEGATVVALDRISAPRAVKASFQRALITALEEEVPVIAPSLVVPRRRTLRLKGSGRLALQALGRDLLADCVLTVRITGKGKQRALQAKLLDVQTGESLIELTESPPKTARGAKLAAKALAKRVLAAIPGAGEVDAPALGGEPEIELETEAAPVMETRSVLVPLTANAEAFAPTATLELDLEPEPEPEPEMAPSGPVESDLIDLAAWEEGAADAAGFSSVDAAGAVELDVAPASNTFALKGMFRSQSAAWIERLGGEGSALAKARQNLDVELRAQLGPVRLQAGGHVEYDLAYRTARELYDERTLKAYELQVRPGESFISLSLSPLDITAGFQSVAWGEANMISVLDVVNPRDLREPGLSDLEDLRLPVLSSRVGLTLGQHRLEAMVLHESYFGLRSPPLGPFSPIADDFEGVRATKRVFDRDSPYRFSGEQQVFGRWSYKGEGIDLGFYGAWLLDRTGVLVLPEDVELFVADYVDIDVVHQRYVMFGHSGALPLGALVLKWELGLDVGRPLNLGSLQVEEPELAITRRNVVNTLVGAQYTGIEGLVLALEISKSFALAQVSDLTVDVHVPVAAARVEYRTLRDQLHLLAFASMIGPTAELGWLARAEASYRLFDDVELSAGYITYHPGKEFGPFDGFHRHDRVSVDLRFDFAAAL